MREFWESANVTADKILQLPTKFVDTRFVLCVQIMFSLSLLALIAIGQLSVINSCVMPIPSSLTIKK